MIRVTYYVAIMAMTLSMIIATGALLEKKLEHIATVCQEGC